MLARRGILLTDIALGDALGWGLIRTQTIADGRESCDFRFKKGSETKISSKTPDVQATIEKIRKKENEGALKCSWGTMHVLLF